MRNGEDVNMKDLASESFLLRKKKSSQKRLLKTSFIIALVLTWFLAGWPLIPKVMAESTTVTTMAELRAAILDAEIDVININPGNYVLTSTGNGEDGELTIGRTLTIQNTGGGRVVIDADDSSKVFNITADTVTMTGLTITGANTPTDGGAMYIGLAATSLTMTSCTISGNKSDDDGAGFDNFAPVTLTNCTISGNTAGDD